MSVVFFWLVCDLAAGQERGNYIPLSKTPKGVGLGVQYFVDKSGQKTLADITKLEDADFLTYDKSMLSFGYSTDTYWLKIKLKNPLKKSQRALLVLKYPLIDQVNFYQTSSSGKVYRKASGDVRPFSSRFIPFRGFAFPVRFSAKSEETVYLQISSTSSLSLPIDIWQPAEFYRYLAEEKLAYGLYYGCIVAILAYNFFLFIFTKSKSYGAYLIFLAASMYFYITWTGVGNEYLWGDNQWLTQRGFLLSTMIISFSIILFQYYFLNIAKEYRRLKKAYVVMGTLFICGTIVNIFLPITTGQRLSVIAGLVCVLFAYAISLYAMFKGNRSALFFTVAWSMFIFFIILGGLSASGIVDLGENMVLISNYGSQIGSAVEAILLSIGLADRINIMRRKEIEQTEKIVSQSKELERKSEEARLAQEKVIEVQQESIEKLDVQVKERTKNIRDILENIELGIFTFNSDYIVQEDQSTHLKTLIGSEDIVGTDVRRSFFEKLQVDRDDLHKMINTFAVSFDEDPDLSWEVNASNLILESGYARAGKITTLALDYAVVLDEALGTVVKILVAVKDISYLKDLEAQAAAKDQENTILLEMLQNSLLKTKSFIDQTMSRKAPIKRALGHFVDKPIKSYESLFRDFHTIKGNARALSFKSIASLVHEIENELDLVGQQTNAKNLRSFDRLVDSFFDYLSQYDKLYKDKFSSLGGDQLVFAPISLVDHLEGDLHRTMIELAQSLGKPTPQLLVQGDPELLIASQSVADFFTDVFNHVARNALDHGIEMPETRKQKGKTAHGTLIVDLSKDKQSYVLTAGDDGQGLNLAKILAKAEDKGLTANLSLVEDIGELIFDASFSTAAAVTEISGRGVGMNAVRSKVEEVGGTISIQYTFNDKRPSLDELRQLDNYFVPIHFVIELPSSFINGSKSNTGEPRAS